MRKISGRLQAIRALLGALLAGSAGGVALAQSTQDELDWSLARATGTADAYERYLSRHPLGSYAGDAFYRLTVLSIDPTRGLAGIEPGAGPDSAGPDTTANALAGTVMDVY